MVWRNYQGCYFWSKRPYKPTRCIWRTVLTSSWKFPDYQCTVIKIYFVNVHEYSFERTNERSSRKVILWRHVHDKHVGGLYHNIRRRYIILPASPGNTIRLLCVYFDILHIQMQRNTDELGPIIAKRRIPGYPSGRT